VDYIKSVNRPIMFLYLYFLNDRRIFDLLPKRCQKFWIQTRYIWLAAFQYNTSQIATSYICLRKFAYYKKVTIAQGTQRYINLSLNPSDILGPYVTMHLIYCIASNPGYG